MTDIDALVQRLAAESPERLRQLAAEVDIVIGNKPFVPNEGPQSAAYYSKADVLLYGGQAGGGKDLEINTLVPVPLSTDASGYKKHGELRAGDEVFAPDGRAVSVIGIPFGVDERDAYEVEFDTGEIIIAGAGHLWQTWTYKERDRLLRSSDAWRENRKKRRASRAKENAKNYWLKDVLTKINKEREHSIIQAAPGIRTTAEIKDTLFVRGERLNHSVDVIKPITGEHIELPCDPYLFGLWLGDGFTNHSAIVMMESDWLEIIDRLPAASSIKIENNQTNTEMGIRRFNELAFVRKIGAKHIPIEYLRASREQRLELLRGMMDADGTIDHRGHCELGFSNAALAHDACELINSLGIKTSINIRRYQKEEWKDHFRMKFICDDIVFHLPRKAHRQKPVVRDTVRRRYIKDVRYIGKRQTSCISVEGGLYCIGDTFIATHNSALGLGLAINEHERSLIVRKQFTDLQGLIDTAKKIVGNQEGFVGGNRPIYRMGGERVIHFEGYGDVDDIDGKQGTPHDLVFVDEAAQLPELAIRLLRGWNRTTTKGQRCRMILASNPPLNSTGDWMITYFGPWLDARHPNPAKPGELRWFISDEEGNDKEVDGPDSFIEINGKKFYPESRTFIPASVSDNPYLDASYASTLNSLPEPYRSALRDGNFMAARADDEWQVIPTDWIRQAQARWKEHGRPIDVPMCVLAVDIAQGGCFDDKTEILTDGGWKFFDDLNGAERVLTLNGKLSEWGEITRIHKYRHVGEMNLYSGYRGIDFCITDNHQMLYIPQKKNDWTIRRFDNLPAHSKLVNTCKWSGQSDSHIVFCSDKKMPNGGICKKEYKFSMTDWAMLIGWVVSEGSTFKEKRDGGRYRVNISQLKPEGMKAIGDLLTRMGIKAYKPKSRSGWEFSINSIGRHLIEHCGSGAKNKRIPDYIKNGSQDVIEAFLEAYGMGDGSVNGSGVVSYSTTSLSLVNDLQEILGKIGQCGTAILQHKAGTKFYIGERKVIRKNDCYIVYRRQPRNVYLVKNKVRRIPYDGYVYCVSTPHKSIFVRRNGKAMWSGNSDSTILSARYDGWFDELKKVSGSKTPDGPSVAGLVIQHRRDGADVVLDYGGGYGGDAGTQLIQNGIPVIKHKGAESSSARTRDRSLGFVNKRTEIYWRLREALDPSQDGGSPIMLPDDPELLADLTAPIYEVTSNGIKLEPKDKLKKRIGRSPDKGDAVAMCWAHGKKIQNIKGGWKQYSKTREKPNVILGHANKRRHIYKGR